MVGEAKSSTLLKYVRSSGHSTAGDAENSIIRLRGLYDAEELALLDEHLTHGRAIRAVQRAAREQA